MAAHSSVLALRIPGTGEPGGLPSLGSHRVGHNWSDLAAAAAASSLWAHWNILAYAKWHIQWHHDCSERESQKGGSGLIPQNRWNNPPTNHPTIQCRSCLLRWTAFCLWNVYFCFHFTMAHSWIPTYSKPSTFTWWPIPGTHLRPGAWPSFQAPLSCSFITKYINKSILLTHHFASYWIPSAPRQKEPEFH